MARRDDHHEIHYTTVLPATNHPHRHQSRSHHSRVQRQSQDSGQSHAQYIEFESAFQDQATHQDYFGFHPPAAAPSIPYAPANFHLQSVEMISEVQNKNSPIYSRYYSSRDTSHSSTPLNQSPYPFAYPSPPVVASALNQVEFNLRDSTKTNGHVVETPNVNLPQYFLVKYLGRSACNQIWGSKAVRTPIDDMVHSARQLPSLSELPTLEICVNSNGLVLTHHQSSSSSPHRHHHRSRSPDRSHYGQIPIENISYAMHDVKYSKIASCIVLRQSKSKNQTSETLTECYVFLFQSKDHALRFTLALAKAFNGDKQSNRLTKHPSNEKREGRSKHRHEKVKSDHHHHHHQHFRDSHV